MGVDFGWNNGIFCNQPIVAIEDGEVVGCADGYGNTYPSQRIYGNYVNISHGNGYWSMYGHLLKGITVKKGQRVRKGQVIGYMGNSGYSNGQHLHFELRKGSNTKISSVDPLGYLFVEDEAIYVNPDSKQYNRILHKKTTVGSPVPRDETRLQVEVITPTLNARAGYGLSAKRLGYATLGLYNVISEKDADGYTWAEIEEGVYVAQKEGVYTKKYQPVENPTLYKVVFPTVSLGDKNALVQFGKGLMLEVKVTEV